MVVQYKRVKKVTETVFSLGEVFNIIEDALGSDIVNALIDFTAEEKKEEKYNVIEYIEDGIFAKQVEESDLIKDIVKNLLLDLDEEGYLKKNKNIDKFNYDEDFYNEIIDEKLSPGIMAYFKY